MSHPEIRTVESTEALYACFSVMHELRPHLSDAADFVKRVERMRSQHYVLLAVYEKHQPVALAGYRLQENLVYGRFMYVDDLVVTAHSRSSGHGALLLNTLEGIAVEQNCAKLVLDTGIDNALAQRFYFRQGLLTGAIRFSKWLGVHAA